MPTVLLSCIDGSKVVASDFSGTRFKSHQLHEGNIEPIFLALYLSHKFHNLAGRKYKDEHNICPMVVVVVSEGFKFILH